MALGDTLRSRREELGLTQTEIAARLRWSQPQVSRLEADGVDLRVSQVADVARAYEVAPDVLAGVAVAEQGAA